MAASSLWSNASIAVNARSERRSDTSVFLPRRRLPGPASATSFSSAFASNCCHVLKSSHKTRITRIIVRASVEPNIIPSWDKSSLRFSEEATKVILLAQEETRRLGQAFVGTEQILLGLIGESTGIPSKVFKSMGISLDKARVEVEKIVEGGSVLPCVETPFTPHAKRVLEFSMKEAQQYGHDYVETEHLLLGLLRYGKGVAIHVIEFLGANPSEIKEQVIRMIGEGTILVDVAYDSSPKMVTLEEYGTNLTKLAQEGKLDPIVGRQKQIERVAQVIGRRTKNNPCLVGEPGVGKTAIVEGLAQWMVDDIAPESIRGKTVVALDMDLLTARTTCCEKSEKKMAKMEKMEKIIDELKQRDDVILYIDKIHALIDENAIDRPTNILKLALARGEFQCIGATTLGGYKNLIARDPVLARKFQTVEVLRASLDEIMEILKASRERYEIHHKVRYEDKALAAAARFSHQDISKAIDLIDEAGSRVRMRHSGKLDDGGLVVTEGDIVDILSPRTRGPIKNVSTNDFERLLHMEELDLRRELETLVAQGEKARPCVIESMLKIIQDVREFRMNKPR